MLEPPFLVNYQTEAFSYPVVVCPDINDCAAGTDDFMIEFSDKPTYQIALYYSFDPARLKKLWERIAVFGVTSIDGPIRLIIESANCWGIFGAGQAKSWQP